jgi:hypothetical protein
MMQDDPELPAQKRARTVMIVKKPKVAPWTKPAQEAMKAIIRNDGKVPNAPGKLADSRIISILQTFISENPEFKTTSDKLMRSRLSKLVEDMQKVPLLLLVYVICLSSLMYSC